MCTLSQQFVSFPGTTQAFKSNPNLIIIKNIKHIDISDVAKICLAEAHFDAGTTPIIVV